jgi:germacradienol/geosmin synthase
MLDSWVWELHNHIQNRIPDPIDYIEMRRQTFGSELGLSLSEPADAAGLPSDIYRSRPIRALINSVADATGLLNDMVSFWKEIEAEGELNNGLLVIQRFLDCDLQQAACVVNDLRTARLRQFEHVKATELPAVMEHFELSADARQALTKYVENLENWCSGVIQWHLECPRYHERRRHPAYRAKEFLARPGGMGTSAARVGGLRAAL